jgi:hypothetical protein
VCENNGHGRKKKLLFVALLRGFRLAAGPEAVSLRVGGLYYERIVVIRAVSKTHRSPWQNNRSLYSLLSWREKKSGQQHRE